MNIQHTIRRNDIFYFNLRLRSGNISRVSLKTDSPRQAKSYVKQILKELSQMDKEQITKELLHSIVSQVISKLTPLVSPTTTSHTFLAEESAPIRIKAATNALLSLNHSWHDAPINHDYIHHHLSQVKTATHKILESHSMGNHSEVISGVSALRKMYVPDNVPSQPSEQITTSKHSLTLEQVSQQFLEHLATRLSKISLKNKRSYLLHTLKYFDQNHPITEVDHNYLEECWHSMLSAETKSTSLLKKRKTALKDLFIYCIKQSLITANPLDLADLDISGTKTARTMFPPKIHQSIISYCKSDLSNTNAWGVLIMAYSGMRNSEVSSCKLLTRDNIPYFHISEGKTDNASRRIPVHQSLLDLGIENIFPTLKVNPAYLTLYYNQTLKPTLDIPTNDSEGSLYNLYSLRHNFITALQTLPSASQSYVKVLVGHKDITSNYTHLSTSNLPDLQAIINQLR
ncbi:tyrosine-type recombinase/integrase [Vibrio crassostreae]|uniref:tyrosine-type recombinase/integrase n=1 Tax=Vibrio crassostreae TaxID=246167 RepID=UPI00352F72E4